MLHASSVGGHVEVSAGGKCRVKSSAHVAIRTRSGSLPPGAFVCFLVQSLLRLPAAGSVTIDGQILPVSTSRLFFWSTIPVSHEYKPARMRELRK